MEEGHNDLSGEELHRMLQGVVSRFRQPQNIQAEGKAKRKGNNLNKLCDSPVSSDDNEKKLNHNFIKADKSEIYNRQKMQKSRSLSGSSCTLYETGGAIPKYYRRSEPNENRSDRQSPNNQVTRRKWHNIPPQISSYSTEFKVENNRYRPNPRARTPDSISSIDSDRVRNWKQNKFQQWFKGHFQECVPFYYRVPNNPTLEVLLPPGDYLVIPQPIVSYHPLHVLSHPHLGGADKRNKGKTQNPGASNENSNASRKNKKQNAQKITDQVPADQVPAVRTPKARDKDVNTSAASEVSRKKTNPMRQIVASPDELLPNPETRKNHLSEDELSLRIHELKLESESSNSVVSLERASKAPSHEQLSSRDPVSSERNAAHPDRRTPDLFESEEKLQRYREVKCMILEKFPLIDQNFAKSQAITIVNSDAAVGDFSLKVQKSVEKTENVSLQSSNFTLGADRPESRTLWGAQKDSRIVESGGIVDEVIEECRQWCEAKLYESYFPVILNLLPDIDIQFVLDTIKVTDSQENITSFVNTWLDEKKYPKSVDFDPVIRRKTKLWKNYVTDFSVETFLDRVPTPMITFLGSNPRKTSQKIDEELGVKYLAYRYDISTSLASTCLINNDKCLSRTCQELDSNVTLINNNIPDWIMKDNFSETFLQELAFIANKERISNYLDREKELKKEEYETALAENAFLTCGCCFDEEIVVSEATVCTEGHICCKSCLTRFAEVSIGERNTSFRCTSENCDGEYTAKELERVLNKQLFSALMLSKAVVDVEMAQVPDLEKCPACDYAYVPAPGNMVFKCANEDCLRETCRKCKEISHIPFPCKEVQKDVAARIAIEEAMNEKLIHSCPKCHVRYIRLDGCNKISCPCGTFSCYLCGKVISVAVHCIHRSKSCTLCKFMKPAFGCGIIYSERILALNSAMTRQFPDEDTW